MTLQFGGRDNNITSFDKARAVIIPVPFGKTVSYRRGTEKGPRAILDASDKMELFDEELHREIHRIGINTLALLKVKGLKPKDMVNLVEGRVSDIYRSNKLPVVIGGEHSVTIGAAAAARKRYKDMSILYFDSHYDLKDTYEGSKYSHACVARRLAEIAPVIEAGVRSLSKEEYDFLAKNKNIKATAMSDMVSMPDWVGTLKQHLSRNIYITIDLDVFDPSIMPSVGTPEPGGIGWYEFLKAVRHIIMDKNVVGFDVVELCPIRGIVAPDFTAAKLIYKLLGYIFLAK